MRGSSAYYVWMLLFLRLAYAGAETGLMIQSQQGERELAKTKKGTNYFEVVFRTIDGKDKDGAKEAVKLFEPAYDNLIVKYKGGQKRKMKKARKEKGRIIRNRLQKRGTRQQRRRRRRRRRKKVNNPTTEPVPSPATPKPDTPAPTPKPDETSTTEQQDELIPSPMITKDDSQKEDPPPKEDPPNDSPPPEDGPLPKPPLDDDEFGDDDNTFADDHRRRRHHGRDLQEDSSGETFSWLIAASGECTGCGNSWYFTDDGFSRRLLAKDLGLHPNHDDDPRRDLQNLLPGLPTEADLLAEFSALIQENLPLGNIADVVGLAELELQPFFSSSSTKSSKSSKSAKSSSSRRRRTLIQE